MAGVNVSIPLDQAEHQVLKIQSRDKQLIGVDVNGTQIGTFGSIDEAKAGRAFPLSDGRSVGVQLAKHGGYRIWEARIDGRLVYGSAHQQHRSIWMLWLAGGGLLFVAELFELASTPELLPFAFLDLAINVGIALLFRGGWAPVAWIAAGLHLVIFGLDWLVFFGETSAGHGTAPPIIDTVTVLILREPWFNAKWMIRVLRDVKFHRQHPAVLQEGSVPV